MKGRTRWYPRHIEPVRDGSYECIAYFGGVHFIMKLEWVCGKGFKVDFPLVVKKWRGVTKKEYNRKKLKENNYEETYK